MTIDNRPRFDWRLCQRIAKEAQLLAEEKWIIEALKMMKQDRNCLQIERLHLENLKATMNDEGTREQLSAADAAVAAPEAPEASGSQTREEPETVTPEALILQTMLSRLEGPTAGIDDEMCNNETLNLAVTDSVFTNGELDTYDTEEDEDDLENGFEDDDMENALIEMNMLMNVRHSES